MRGIADYGAVPTRVGGCEAVFKNGPFAEVGGVHELIDGCLLVVQVGDIDRG